MAAQTYQNDPQSHTLAYARALDAEEPLRHLRDEFTIPSKADVKRNRIERTYSDARKDLQPSIYLCGNSLGLQPKRTSHYIQKYLQTWATKGVYGHFKELEDQITSPWLQLDDDVKVEMAKLVGAQPEEVAVMQTLTANLHLLMASFYRPTKERYKIILEGKAFPSDHYAVESQIHHHSLSPSDAMVLIKPPADNSPYLPTSHILSIIDEHASTTSLLLLPGIQFYTGQLFDIATITAHAHSRGITVGWDLAHAVGNVPLKLHEWAVDFAVWCNYKYMNSGPGAIGGLFVHEKHGSVGTPPPASESTTPSESERQPSAPPYRPRLSGWWGSDKQSRFAMTNAFVPIPGASGYQLSNPSAVDTTAVLASLSVFASTSIDELRKKSLRLTGYLEYLLLWDHGGSVYEIITPLKEAERGAQLSVKLKEGMLEGVMKVLEEEGVVVDERRPDVVRVAPTPLYNTFEDVWRFVDVFRMACSGVRMGEKEGEGAVMVEAASEDKGWGEVK